MDRMKPPPMPTEPIDPVCAIHGKHWSEHPGGRCLYCCLCFRPLTSDECHVLPDGTREDVCNECAAAEVKQQSNICPSCGSVMYPASVLKGYEKTGEGANRPTCALHGPLGPFRHLGKDRETESK